MAGDAITYDQMRDLLREQAGMLRGAGATGGGGGGGGDTGAGAGIFRGAIDKTVGGLGALATGTATTKDVLGATTGFLNQFGTAGFAAGKVLGTMGGAVLDVNNTLRETGKYGVSFGQNLGEANKAVLQAQLTMPEFQEMVRTSGKSFAGMAGGQNESAKAFLGLAKEMQGTTVAQDLKAAGMSSVELNSALLLTSRNSFRVNMDDVQARKEAVGAALSMATEMNKVADLTGKSRKQQEDEIRRIQERADVEAAVLLKQKTDPNFGKNIDAASAAMSRFGPKVQELLAEEATGGARSEDAIKTKAALGPAAEAVAEYGRALESGNATRIAEAKKAAELAIAERVDSEEFLKTAKVTQGNVLNMGDLVHGSMQYTKNITAEQEELAKQGKVATKEAAEASIAAKAEAKARGMKIDEKTGKEVKDEGAVVGRSINQIENLGKVAGGVMAEGFNTLNKSLGKTVLESFPAFDAKLRGISANPAALTSGVQKAINDAAKAAGVKVPTTTGPDRTSGLVSAGPDAAKAAADAVVKATKDIVKPATPEPAPKPAVPAPATEVKKVSGQAASEVGTTKPADAMTSKFESLKSMFTQAVAAPITPNATSADQLKASKIEPAAAKQQMTSDDLVDMMQKMTATAGQPMDNQTMTDLKEQLAKLNTTMQEVAKNTAEVADLSGKQVRATKGLSGNRLAS